MPTARTLFLCLLSLVAARPNLSAQAIVLPQTIAFTGAPSYTQAELLAYTSLKPGDTSTQQQLQSAAQHLSDTGLFADVRFASTPKGLIFDLKPMPPEAVLPARFTNLVFWQRPELLAALQSRIPLFHESVPTSGTMQDALIAALQAMLTERGVAGATVVATPSAAPGQAPTAIAFAINTPDVLVHAVTVLQSSPAMQATLAPVLANLAGKPYEEAETLRSAAIQIADAYRNAGYLDIGVGGLTHTAPTVTPTAIDVDLAATVNEGEVYHLSTLTWPGSPVEPAADFEKSTKLHPGDVASQQALRQSLAVIARAYYAKGYQDAKVRAPAALDAAKHEVAYTVSVVPATSTASTPSRPSASAPSRRKTSPPPGT